jgi:hypothetical protein
LTRWRGRHAPPDRSAVRKTPQVHGPPRKNPEQNSRSQLAYTERGRHWTTSRNILRHEGLKCVNEAMNSLRWLKTESIDKLFVRREVPGPGLSDENLAETFVQHGAVAFMVLIAIADLGKSHRAVN